MRDPHSLLRSTLKKRGWELHWQSEVNSWSGPAIRGQDWWVERRSPPGGLVFVQLRSPVVFGGPQPQVVVRRIQSGTLPAPPQVVLEPQQASADGFRQLFRVLDWFADPDGWSALNDPSRPGDWTPRAEWFSAAWSGPEDGVVFWSRWLEPKSMLSRVEAQLTPRKRLLLACALCRLAPQWSAQESSRPAVEAVERFARGLLSRREMKAATRGSVLHWLTRQDDLRATVERALTGLTEQTPPRASLLAADTVREVVVNPFRPIEIQYSWIQANGGGVRHLRDAIATDGRFEELPVLADALEDGGCAEPALLEHLRRRGGHVRGCWALDLLGAK
jgi:hypothetical protein